MERAPKTNNAEDKPPPKRQKQQEEQQPKQQPKQKRQKRQPQPQKRTRVRWLDLPTALLVMCLEFALDSVQAVQSAASVSSMWREHARSRAVSPRHWAGAYLRC